MQYISFKSGDNKQKLQKVNLLDILPTHGEGRDHIVQNLISKNRQTYIPIFLTQNKYCHCLEFQPDLLNDSNVYLSDTNPYRYDVYISNIHDKKDKKFIFTMHCEGDNTISSFASISSSNNTAFSNTTYVFEDGMEIITDKYFTLNNDDIDYLKEKYTEKLVLISTITYLLTRTITSSYNINDYHNSDFLDLKNLENIEIKEEYRNIINALLGNEEDSEFYYKEILLNYKSAYQLMSNGNIITLQNRPFNNIVSGIDLVDDIDPNYNIDGGKNIDDFKE